MSAFTKEWAVLRAATVILRLDKAQCGSLPAWDTAINHTAELWVNLQVTTHFNVCMRSDKGQCYKGSESPEAAGCLFVSQAWSCSVAAGLTLWQTGAAQWLLAWRCDKQELLSGCWPDAVTNRSCSVAAGLTLWQTGAAQWLLVLRSCPWWPGLPVEQGVRANSPSGRGQLAVIRKGAADGDQEGGSDGDQEGCSWRWSGRGQLTVIRKGAAGGDQEGYRWWWSGRVQLTVIRKGAADGDQEGGSWRAADGDQEGGSWRWSGRGQLTVIRKGAADGDQEGGSWRWSGRGQLTVIRKDIGDGDQEGCRWWWSECVNDGALTAVCQGVVCVCWQPWQLPCGQEREPALATDAGSDKGVVAHTFERFSEMFFSLPHLWSN